MTNQDFYFHQNTILDHCRDSEDPKAKLDDLINQARAQALQKLSQQQQKALEEYTQYLNDLIVWHEHLSEEL